ncbi:hypothetical protein N7501_004141 [Penicillium viridicatum]|nr:hypothetical protein N7501_004141 [Penicillium viridicatum]
MASSSRYHPINIPSRLDIKHNANKHKVGDRAIKAPTDYQLEVLTELREAVSTRASVGRQLLHEATQIMHSVNVMMAMYRNSGIAPATHSLYLLEERMIALLDQISSLRAQEDFYRDLELQLFAQMRQ